MRKIATPSHLSCINPFTWVDPCPPQNLASNKTNVGKETNIQIKIVSKNMFDYVNQTSKYDYQTGKSAIPFRNVCAPRESLVKVVKVVNSLVQSTGGGSNEMRPSWRQCRLLSLFFLLQTNDMRVALRVHCTKWKNEIQTVGHQSRALQADIETI